MSLKRRKIKTKKKETANSKQILACATEIRPDRR
jgi:hypothetical protein